MHEASVRLLKQLQVVANCKQPSTILLLNMTRHLQFLVISTPALTPTVCAYKQHTHTHVHHTHTHAHTQSHTHTCTNTQPHTHTHACTNNNHTHACTNTHNNAQPGTKHGHAQAHRQPHTHKTLTHAPPVPTWVGLLVTAVFANLFCLLVSRASLWREGSEWHTGFHWLGCCGQETAQATQAKSMNVR